jgi:hypothetical protein
MTLKPVSLDPLMGTTEETFPGSGVYYYVFGGAPKSDWSGIKNPDTQVLSDLCYLSLDPVSGQKSTHYRIKGLEKPFDRSQKLSDFQKNVSEHLIKYGLDNVRYLPDPKNSFKVQLVVNFHARFTGDIKKSLAESRRLGNSLTHGIAKMIMKLDSFS